MKNLLFALVLLSFMRVQAQTNVDFLKEINRDVWVPFIEAYGTANGSLYKSLHTADFIRASSIDKSLPDAPAYFERSGAWFDEVKADGRRLSIAFRFMERFANEKVATERGIYALTMFDKNGKQTWVGYGKFHVFMRKIDGKWKIAVDYDSNEGNTINEASFNAAFAHDDFAKY